MSEHAWFQENLGGFCADGLSIDERERFERHRVACKPCAQILAEYQGFDVAMDNLFAEVRPVAGWETRVVENLRAASPYRRFVAAKWFRLVASVAALVVLGAFGAVLHGVVVKGKLVFPGTEAEATASRYVQVSNQFGLDRINEAETLIELTDTDRLGDVGFRNLGENKDAPEGGDRSKERAELKATLGRERREDGFTLLDKVRPLTRESRTTIAENTYYTPLSSATNSFAREAGQPKGKDGEAAKVTAIGNKLLVDSGSLAERSRKRQVGFSLLQSPKSDVGEQKLGELGQPAEAAARKTIRTGEIEFEIDGFDAAVAGITGLVNGVPGGFVATVNSDKLPNGKVKGSVVVRLPPEKLDKFLLDVRQELGKAGDLKSQRIGSQDVTKQYTDVESRLRGARAMEERFLQIIKTGKGEIKDLVVAENALGVWRTKIEEMEGEIRYFNNQVGLSTLTITLYEKEIQAAASLVVTERRKLQLEVDDVDKAQQAALAAVAQAKGRVTRSEIKQHAAGQFEAILHFAIAPTAANALGEQLKQLGIVINQDSDRTEQTQGGGSQGVDIKIKHNDVQFEVGMYNVANIQPREVLVLQMASLDVPAGFRKLQEIIGKIKGQVRTGQLNEQDKLNIVAQLDFDVPSQEKKAIDQALGEVGKIIARNSTRAAPGEAATDRKIGYRLTLRDVTALPSREKDTLGIEVKDVYQAAQEVRDMIKGKKGRIVGDKTTGERNGQVSAVLIFEVPLSTKDEVLRQLKTTGTVRVQTSTDNPQVADNELATAHFEVALVGSTPIVPSDEGLWPQIRTSLSYSAKLLSWSLMFVVLGLSVVLPWMLVLWVGYRFIRAWRKKPVGP